MRKVWLIARSVLIEAVRRKEIYAIVLLSVLLMGVIMTVDFFQIKGLTKFYREMALKIMSIATALLVIVLASRQLPREFENRTIYPLLAKPVGRLSFLTGKLLGVLLAAVFCFSLFMLIFIIGTYYLGGTIPWTHFAQYIYMQLLAMLVLSSLGFLLSLVMNLDAAIVLGVLFYITSNILTMSMMYLYHFMSEAGKFILTIMNYAIPQLALLDFSDKVIHAEEWPPLSIGTLLAVTAYALFFAGIYFALSIFFFSRREL